MAIVQCKECGGMVSTQARSCPHCGAVMSGTAFCRKCGKKIDEEAVICPYCGVPQGKVTTKTGGVKDDGNIGWGILGFFIPLAGLILYLIWRDSKYNNAMMAGKGALISVSIAVVCTILGACTMMM